MTLAPDKLWQQKLCTYTAFTQNSYFYESLCDRDNSTSVQNESETQVEKYSSRTVCFVEGNSSSNAIFVLRMLSERCIEKGQKCNMFYCQT